MLIFLQFFFSLFLLSSFTSANIFTITDKKGHIVSISNITANNDNHFLKQKNSEYANQGIYKALHHEQNMAFLAKTSRQHIQGKGKIYTLSDNPQHKLLQDAKMFNGSRYIWGGTSPDGFDCSGYVQYLYKKHSISLPRTALEQSKAGKSIALSEIRKGDLLFFLTDKSRGIPITHVGIYLGDGTFIHAASSKKGIIISPLHTGHYANIFVSARRVIKQKS